MNRMACADAWAVMKANFVFMSSSPPIRNSLSEKSRGLAQHLDLLLQPFVVPTKLRQLGGLGLLRRDRRRRACSLELEPPGLQLCRRDAKLGSHTAIRRTRLRKSGNRLSLALRRKPPPRLLRHLVPPGRFLIYRLVRLQRATTASDKTGGGHADPGSNGRSPIGDQPGHGKAGS
jgi:hypothetical protein